ncbi:MgtC/SapB family protein [Planococcus sp. 1R117A]|uniref:MgtC/SapB family protein n=1 Tax=Planococcus sp. 1R117A TaxID=3447020 RepID=UPI003EDC91E5
MDFLPGDYLSIIIRLLIAAFLSGLIGIEREAQQQPAGLRTHLLVGTGSCLMMILSVTGFDAFLARDSDAIRFDPSRIPSYVISGIGFLGAGTIIVHRGSVKGLTTAASVWVAAGLGLVVGIGMYFVAILTTVIVLVALSILGKLEAKYLPSHNPKEILVIAEDREDVFSSISGLFEENKVVIMDFHIETVEAHSDKNVSAYRFIIRDENIKNEIELVKKLQQHKSVYKVTK